MNTFLKKHLKLASLSHRFFMKIHDFLGIDFRIDLFLHLFMKMAPKMNDPVIPGPPKKQYFSKPSLLCRFFTLRACPPTHLHAPYLYVPCTLAPCPASAMRMLTPWVGGTKGPKGGGPGAQGAARGRTRAARAHGRTRALRALGPFGPLGPLGPKGTAFTQHKLCQTE